MKKQSISIKMLSIALAGSILLASCSSSTMIQSTPSGAKVYIDGQPVGNTPYSYSDTKVVGSGTTVRLEKEGYETLNTGFSRSEQADVGAIIGGLFFLVPFLWTMKYNPTHTYELKPNSASIQNSNYTAPVVQDTNSKEHKLQQLKDLFEKKLITQEEYDTQRKKILEED